MHSLPAQWALVSAATRICTPTPLNACVNIQYLVAGRQTTSMPQLVTAFLNASLRSGSAEGGGAVRSSYLLWTLKLNWYLHSWNA